MTSSQVRTFKRHFVVHLNRLAKAVRRMRGMKPVRRKKVELGLYRELKKEGKVIARMDRRYSRLARAA